MTNHWVDIKNADVILVMGGNAAEAHPCGFKWVTEAKAHNKAKLIVVDPRFTRTASVADYPRCDAYRHGHRIPGRDHQLSADERQDPARVRAELHGHVLHRARRLRVRRRHVLGLRREKGKYADKSELGLRDGRGRLRQGRSDACNTRAASTS
jgi:hypothetical protein